jgi:hypothetical protein
MSCLTILPRDLLIRATRPLATCTLSPQCLAIFSVSGSTFLRIPNAAVEPIPSPSKKVLLHGQKSPLLLERVQRAERVCSYLFWTLCEKLEDLPSLLFYPCQLHGSRRVLEGFESGSLSVRFSRVSRSSQHMKLQRVDPGFGAKPTARTGREGHRVFSSLYRSDAFRAITYDCAPL